MNAAEAKELSLFNKQELVRRQMEVCLVQIEKAVGYGFSSVSIKTQIPAPARIEVMCELEKLGYSVRYDRQIRISW